jgi:tRNA modification GTPase
VFSTDDTIAAIATSLGRGGIGVVRLSGASALRIAGLLLDADEPLQPRRATVARAQPAIDQVVATCFPGPHSYTGEDVVEISAHGSPVVLREILGAAIRAGARMAGPGEFTLRAFLNGRMDLVQAEAVADLVDASTPLQARVAFDQLEGTLTGRIAELSNALFDVIARLEASLDFPEEVEHFVAPGGLAESLLALDAGLASLLADARRGRLIREGAVVAIVGAPNVGKSSVFNFLAGAARAIVDPAPGTTRDLVSERVDLEGFRVDLIDTAGIRDGADAVEAEGVARARRAAETAALAVLVLDRSRPLGPEDRALLGALDPARRIVAVNKIDLLAAWDGGSARLAEGEPVLVSMKTGAGAGALRSGIVRALEGAEGGGPAREHAAVTNIRHVELLRRAHAALARAREGVAGPGPAASDELVLVDLQEARSALEEITGTRTTEDLLEHIFSRFCVGK